MEQFVELLKQDIVKQISNVISSGTVTDLVREQLFERYLVSEKRPAKFQMYYFKILNNDAYYYNCSEGFFVEFKKRYSLQGIDRTHLEYLEQEKENIMDLIVGNKLPDLYYSYFRNQSIKQKNGTVKKDLVSFFAKLVHTFRPLEYCPLDNPIKNYFGLRKESFLIAFWAISKAYREWSRENSALLNVIRIKFKEFDSGNTHFHDQITDMKLLDMIFWSIANSQKQKA